MSNGREYNPRISSSLRSSHSETLEDTPPIPAKQPQTEPKKEWPSKLTQRTSSLHAKVSDSMSKILTSQLPPPAEEHRHPASSDYLKPQEYTPRHTSLTEHAKQPDYIPRPRVADHEETWDSHGQTISRDKSHPKPAETVDISTIQGILLMTRHPNMVSNLAFTQVHYDF